MGCGDREALYHLTLPATQGDRRHRLVLGWAKQIGPNVWCNAGGRCNKCRTLELRGARRSVGKDGYRQ